MSKSSKRFISHSEISLTARLDTNWGYFITVQCDPRWWNYNIKKAKKWRRTKERTWWWCRCVVVDVVGYFLRDEKISSCKELFILFLTENCTRDIFARMWREHSFTVLHPLLRILKQKQQVKEWSAKQKRRKANHMYPRHYAENKVYYTQTRLLKVTILRACMGQNLPQLSLINKLASCLNFLFVETHAKFC